MKCEQKTSFTPINKIALGNGIFWKAIKFKVCPEMYFITETKDEILENSRGSLSYQSNLKQTTPSIQSNESEARMHMVHLLYSV